MRPYDTQGPPLTERPREGVAQIEGLVVVLLTGSRAHVRRTEVASGGHVGASGHEDSIAEPCAGVWRDG